jgi:hypothetical protein
MRIKKRNAKCGSPILISSGRANGEISAEAWNLKLDTWRDFTCIFILQDDIEGWVLALGDGKTNLG